MSAPPLVNIYDSRGEDYRAAFKEFLDHTDQKAKAMAWLEHEIDSLPVRRVFIDAGAGNGKLTTWFVPRFDRVIAIEPNPSLAQELRSACPTAVVIPTMIRDADPPMRADFVLCSHVFYYIDHSEWLESLRHLTGWLETGGVLAVAMQNHTTDCMRMVRHFTGKTLDLPGLVHAFEVAAGRGYEARTDTVPAHIATDTFASAYVIAEFMMNVMPLSSPPLRAELERYVEQHFRRAEGNYRFSCDQDFLRIRRLQPNQ
jgi:hypothetical protein